MGVLVHVDTRTLSRSRPPCLSDAEEEGELEPAKELIQPIAEKIIAKYKAKEEETPLLFFVAGEVGNARILGAQHRNILNTNPNSRGEQANRQSEKKYFSFYSFFEYGSRV